MQAGIDDALNNGSGNIKGGAGFIGNLLNNWGEVNLFIRPRRFGKTLNMSMLKSFFRKRKIS